MTQDTAKPQVNITIDGHALSVDAGTTMYEAAQLLNTKIPHYCYDPDLTIVASCRLCLVEVEKVPKLLPSCSTPCAEGQVIYTQSEKVLEARKQQMEFLLVQHPLDCPVCDQGGECKLQDYSLQHGTDNTRFRYERRTFPKPDIGPFIELERNRCILCTRCTRYMEEIAGNAELAIVQRGNRARISTFQDRPLKNEFAGNTIDLCPVGALTSKITRFRVRPWELKQVESVCSMCSVGCSIHLEKRNRTKEILRITPRENEAINGRWICDIGRFGFDQFNSDDRQRVPLMKNESGVQEASKWGRVVNHTVNTLKSTIEQHGAGSVAGIISPRVSNETLYLFQKFMRDAVGTNNIDHRTETILPDNDDGFITSIIKNAVNNPFDEIKKCDAVLVVGSDLPNALPIIKLQVRSQALNMADPADPHCTPFTPITFYNPNPGKAQEKVKPVMMAYHRPTRLDKDIQHSIQYHPGSEAAFLSAVILELATVRGVAVPASVKSITGSKVNEALKKCGVAKTDLDAIVKTVDAAGHPTILLGQDGFEGSDGVDVVLLASALAEMLISVGESKLPLSLLLPYNNSRGAMDIGCLPHRGPGYHPVENGGKNTQEILQGCIDGRIKALVLFDTDIVEEYPNRAMVQQALDAVPFLVVADSYPFETQKYADVFMPLSTYTEEDGTYTNVSGVVQRSNKAMDQLDGTLAGYQVLLALGERWGTGWKQMDSRKLLERIAGDVAHYAGMTWDSLGALGQASQDVERSLWNGAGRECMFKPASANGHAPDGSFRLVRGKYLFDTAGEKRYAEALVERSEPCVAEINPVDAKRLQVANGENVKIKGEKGVLELPAKVSPATFQGCVTVLGLYDNLPLNGITDDQAPWVQILK
jgi:NADH-quinone oxidoreductase chain G